MCANVIPVNRADVPEPFEHGKLLDSTRHHVLFYEDDGFLIDRVSRFIGAALTAGNAGMIIATPAHRSSVAERLRELGFDLRLVRAEGRFVSVDAAGILSQLLRDGSPDPARFADILGGTIDRAREAVRSEHPTVAIFGELVPLLWAQERKKAALRLEGLWNSLGQTHVFHLLCAYPISLFPRSTDHEHFEKICLEHTKVMPTESYTSLTNEEDQLRAIALLQQQARALAAEIEDRTYLRESLRQREAALAKAIAARDEFLSVAAHELKTPITSMRAYVQLLLREAAREREIMPARLDEALKTIELQTSKLSHLIMRVLERMQIDDGKLRIEPARTDLVGLTRMVLAQQPEILDHPVVFSGPEQLEAWVDPVRFEAVITNLLDNAIKFSPRGGEVTIALGQDGSGDVVLSITDRGVGVPPEGREAAFQRFSPLQNQRYLSGLGLGLSIVREVVERHGGTIRVEQPAHGGSRFVVRLPASVMVDHW